MRSTSRWAAVIFIFLAAKASGADSLIQAEGVTAKKQNALIGRTFNLRGGNAFGSGLISVGYEPHSRAVVKAYFVSAFVSYGAATIVPDVIQNPSPPRQTDPGDGFDVAYVNCKSSTFSASSYPAVAKMSNVERSQFEQGLQNKWSPVQPPVDTQLWDFDLSYPGRTAMAKFFVDLCDATY